MSLHEGQTSYYQTPDNYNPDNYNPHSSPQQQMQDRYQQQYPTEQEARHHEMMINFPPAQQSKSINSIEK